MATIAGRAYNFTERRMLWLIERRRHTASMPEIHTAPRRAREVDGLIRWKRYGCRRSSRACHGTVFKDHPGPEYCPGNFKVIAGQYRRSSVLKLLKDFYRVEGTQRCLRFNRVQVGRDTVWKITDGSGPRFVWIPLETASIAIDARSRHIYARTLHDGSSSNSVGKVARFHLDMNEYPPANYGDTDTNRVTPQFVYEWCFEGNSDKGMPVAPNGNLAIVGSGAAAWMATDGFYYHTNIAQRVTVMDNAGNEILHFGTYGNRDSTGELSGDVVPTKGIPLGFSNSVDATDNDIYVADMVKRRLLRIKKHYKTAALSR